jgi:4-hydroxy-3-polyprenylbenzoate decarboxylase
MQHGRVVIGITGASGAPYARRLLQLLAESGIEVHVVISALGRRLLFDELGIKRFEADSLVAPDLADQLVLHNDNDLGSTIASGSFLHDGMAIVPCSSNTMAAVAAGITNNLVQRAASVAIKERRPLILAHRESPLSRIDVMNMDRLMQAGATIAPLSPGFYLLPNSIDDLVDFMVGKLMDLLGVDHDLSTRWEDASVH